MKLLSFLFALSAIMSLLLERTVVAAEALRGSSDTDVPNNHAHQRGLVNCPMEQLDRERVVVSLERGRPLGEDWWVATTAETMGLAHTLNPFGRPKKRMKI
jgi:hypothetical protein